MAIKFLNTATGITEAAGDNSTKIATTAYADAAAAAVPIGDYVTLATAQTISGAKTFNNDVTLNNTYLLGVDKLEANQIVIGTSTSSILGNVGIGTSTVTNGKLVIEESGTSIGSTIRLIGTNTIAGASQVSHITSYQPSGGGAQEAALDFKVRRNTDAYASPSTVMTLLGSGNVGIGTANPTVKLQVYDDSSSQLKITNGLATPVDLQLFASSSSYAGIGTASNHRLALRTNNTEKVTILANGNVGIGTTSPTHKLQVVGNGAFNSTLGVQDPDLSSNGLLQLSHDSTGSSIYSNPASSNTSTVVLRLGINNSEKMRIANNGNVGIGTTSPLEKLDVRGDIQMYNSYASGVEVKMSHVDPSSGYDSSIIKSVLDTISPQDGGSSMLRFYTNQNSTTSSTVALDLTRSQNAIFYGNVGIGTTSPNNFGFLERVLNISAGSSSSTTLQQAGIIISGSSDADDADDFGYLSFTNYQSTIANDRVAEIRVLKNGTNVDTGEFAFYTSSGSGLAERMRITNTGNVGIGTSSPSAKLDVAGTVNAYGNGSVALQWGDTSALGALSFDTSANPVIRSVSSKPLVFQTNGANERMRITSAGNVGIGVTNPSARLHVDGTVRFSSSGDRIFIADGSFGTFELGDIDGVSDEAKIVGNGSNIIISNTGTETLTCSGNNRVGIGTTSPQSKLDVSGGDIEVKDIASGVIMKSPNGTRYRVTIANGGTLVVTAV
jgi:hypothetical protein